MAINETASCPVTAGHIPLLRRSPGALAGGGGEHPLLTILSLSALQAPEPPHFRGSSQWCILKNLASFSFLVPNASELIILSQPVHFVPNCALKSQISYVLGYHLEQTVVPRRI